MDNATHRKAYPTSAKIPKSYSFPKIHKNTIPLWPKVSCIGSLTYLAYLAQILGPLVGKICPITSKTVRS